MKIDRDDIEIANPLRDHRCFVRLLAAREDCFVEFVFSIDDPSLGVEMILSKPDFEEFCAANQVHFLTAAESAVLDADAAKWRYGQPGLTD